MRDKIIREAFHSTVLRSAHKDPETIVLDELGLRNGGVRADIAVLNGKLVGYEIKTERDTLTRLSSQVEAYSEVFEKAFLIVSKNHLEKAIQNLPSWWGIYTIETEIAGSYTFTPYRTGRLNTKQNTFTLAQLLWKAEALEVANTILRHNVKSNVTKHHIYDIISSKCDRKKLSKIVIQYLKQRDNWRTNLL